MNILRSFLAASLLLTFSLQASAASTFQYTPTKTQAQSSWYSPDWKYRIKITVNHEQVGEEVSDFPMLVKIINNQKFFTNSKENGQDLLFTSADGITKLDHELEQYAKNEQQLFAWVRIPKLSVTEDTVLYMYYGNPNSEDQQRPTNVWRNKYLGVWHLNQDPVDLAKDSTGNERSATSTEGGMNANDSLYNGKIGKGYNIDGNDDRVFLPSGTTFSQRSQATVSAWVKTDTLAGTGGIFGDNEGVGINHMIDRSLTDFRFVLRQSDLTFRILTYPVTVDQYYYLTGTYDVATQTMIFYVNGQRVGQEANWNGTFRAATAVSLIGDFYNSGTYSWDGIIDEVRVSTIPRSGGWIKTEYNNQSDPESFYTLSSEETRTTNTLTTPLLFTYSSLSSFKEQATKNNGTILYQLSPDNGKTWYYVKNNQWIKATKEINASTADVINKNIKNLPGGTNQLKVKAYLKPVDNQAVTLEQLTLTYTPGKATKGSTATPTTLSSGLVTRVNEAFSAVYTRIPTYTEWEYWARRVLNKEKTTFDALVGAISWQKSK